VADVKKSLLFFEKVFDLKPKYVHESGSYAELNTDAVTLALAVESLALSNLSGGYKTNSNKEPPLECEIVFTSIDVESMYQKALRFGAKNIAAPIDIFRNFILSLKLFIFLTKASFERV
jgi:hypothetical protein